jgi:hypothetical protein
MLRMTSQNTDWIQVAARVVMLLYGTAANDLTMLRCHVVSDITYGHRILVDQTRSRIADIKADPPSNQQIPAMHACEPPRITRCVMDLCCVVLDASWLWTTFTSQPVPSYHQDSVQ